MKRREVLIGAATVAATALMSRSARAAESDAREPFAKALGECIAAGNACLQHCLELLATGEKTLGDCAKRVHEMLAICNATEVIIATDSSLKQRLVQVCVDACDQCAEACRPHADQHAVCRRCRDACMATVAAAKLRA